MLKICTTIVLGLDKKMNSGLKLWVIMISPGIGVLANQNIVGIAKLITIFVHLQKGFSITWSFIEKPKLTLSKIGHPHQGDVL